MLTRIKAVRDSLAMKRADIEAAKDAQRIVDVEQKKAALNALLEAQKLMPKAVA